MTDEFCNFVIILQTVSSHVEWPKQKPTNSIENYIGYVERVENSQLYAYPYIYV